MLKIINLALLLMQVTLLSAQKVIPLYQGTIPNAVPCSEKDHEFIDTSWIKSGILVVDHITRPTLTIYQPSTQKRNGTSVIICPGGGYSILAAGHEGSDVAKAFNEEGVTAFVLRYRLPKDECMTNKTYVPLMDAQQAIWLVRTHAREYGVDPHKIGIMGFSAGGHLASTAATHTKPVRTELNSADLRPDFLILIYPVISFNDSIGHMGSRNSLLGKNPDKTMIHLFSNEEQVTSQTPPTFLVHASDDDAVMPENSIRFYQSLLKNRVLAELHLYEHGGHGFGLHNASTNEDWFKSCLEWMKTTKLMQ